MDGSVFHSEGLRFFDDVPRNRKEAGGGELTGSSQY